MCQITTSITKKLYNLWSNVIFFSFSPNQLKPKLHSKLCGRNPEMWKSPNLGKRPIHTSISLPSMSSFIMTFPSALDKSSGSFLWATVCWMNLAIFMTLTSACFSPRSILTSVPRMLAFRESCSANNNRLKVCLKPAMPHGPPDSLVD